jgi:hypothetical protein
MACHSGAFAAGIARLVSPGPIRRGARDMQRSPRLQIRRVIIGNLGAAFGSPLFHRVPKPKPQPGEPPSRGFGASHKGRPLQEGTEHKHQHPF